jgi:hypothetical protein
LARDRAVRRRAAWSREDWTWVLGTLVLGVLLGLGAHQTYLALGGVHGLVAASALLVSGLALTRRASIVYRVPVSYRAWLMRAAEPAAEEPDGARAMPLALSDHWSAAINARDWKGLEGLLADGFAVHRLRPRPPMRRGGYVASLRRLARAYPDFRVEVECVVGTPDDEDVVWIRVAGSGRPRRGAALDYTVWERWRLDGNGERLLAVEWHVVVRVA